MNIGDICVCEETRTTFSVVGRDGELGYVIYCTHGAWYADYDPDMKMIINIRDTRMRFPSKGRPFRGAQWMHVTHTYCFIKELNDMVFKNLYGDDSEVPF